MFLSKKDDDSMAGYNSITENLKPPLMGTWINSGFYKHNQVFMKIACTLHFNHIFLRQGEKPNEG